MKTSIAKAAFLLSVMLVTGCGKKDADKAAPAASATPATPAAGTAPAAAKPTAADSAAPLTAADVPPECKPFIDALEALGKCEKLSADQRQSLIDSNQKMLKAMVKLGDTKASVDGCTQSLPTVQEALKTAGC
jgi:hypothetical protein